MFRYNNISTTITISLPDLNGKSGYSVVCSYRYIKALGKYEVSMWLHWDMIEDLFKIDAQQIDDVRYIESQKVTIKQDICNLIEELFNNGYFNFYINRYEYTYNCFDIGNTICETGDYNK